MKQLGISLIFFSISFSAFSQCGEYVDIKFKCDSCRKNRDYLSASYYYEKCIKYKEFRRIDYYYLSYCLFKSNKMNESYLYLKTAAKKGLHFESITRLLSDSLVMYINNNIPNNKLITLLKKNTTKYLHNLNLPLQQILVEKKIDDQKYRDPKLYQVPDKKRDSSLSKAGTRADLMNQNWLKNEIKNNGWPTLSKVGVEGDRTAWLIVQHADNDTSFQKECLSILLKLIPKNETSISNIAYLQDRILVNTNKEQIYGTQFVPILTEGKTTGLKLRPTINMECLNKRRNYVGLESIEEYLDFARERYVVK